MFYDLNCKINPQKPFAQKELVKSSIEDGYSGIAFNYEFTGALGPQHTNPLKKTDVLGLVNKEMNLLAKPELKRTYEKFQQYSRITLTANDPRLLTQISESNAIVQSYDIIAVRTTNQKIFYSLCLENEVVDIITFDLTEKLPFHLKRGPVTEAIKKGIMFEVTYSQAIEDMSVRRMIFSNAIQLIQATKGKNIIFSSGTEEAFYHRSPYDSINLASVLELSKELAYKAVADNPARVIKRSECRKNFKGTISMATAEEEAKFLEKEEALLAKKKLKTEKASQQGGQTTMEEEPVTIQQTEIVSIETVNADGKTTTMNQEN